MTLSDLECHFSRFLIILTRIHQWIWHVLTTLCVYMDGKVSMVFNRSCFPKMTDFSRLGVLQTVTYTLKVVVSKKLREIDTFLLHTTNRKYHMAYPCHFQVPWITLKVIRIMPDLANAIRRTLVRHLAWFQLSRRVAQSLGDSWAFCLLFSFSVFHFFSFWFRAVRLSWLMSAFDRTLK